jgi:inhibitor of KinA
MNIKWHWLNENAILVEWPAGIQKALLHEIIHFKDYIQHNMAKALVDIVPAYSSILLVIDPSAISHKAVEVLISAFEYTPHDTAYAGNEWEIPVCYEAPYNKDLKTMAEQLKLSPEEIISLHASTSYTVHFIGFLPGFLYLGGLPKALQLPRKKHPEGEISAGSVAIGGEQTGIYPSKSPGGWHVIGKTPVTFFTTKDDPPCFAQAGDTIHFMPISKEELRAFPKNFKPEPRKVLYG